MSAGAVAGEQKTGEGTEAATMSAAGGEIRAVSPATALATAAAAERPAEEGEIGVSNIPEARRKANGFRINSMNMRNAATGALKWESGTWSSELWQHELEAHVPPDILQCPAVSREINFTSMEEMESFRLEQRIFFQGVCMEEWFFDFGFVIPGSTNTWQNTIEAAGGDQMLPASMLSGNVTIETTFYDGEMYLARCLVRIYYDGDGTGQPIPEDGGSGGAAEAKVTGGSGSAAAGESKSGGSGAESKFGGTSDTGV